ncbi:hypothetical protein [Saccharopolyspora sp. NPDC050642]|uniref:hypothetical protein n=1 Tax=Saccharopolyspora sp. NPDC050642 TaxID=3157099 RepID=UPI0033E526AB
MQSASGDASVFVFRMWRRDLAAVEWKPGPRLLVHIAEDGSAVPEQLSWVTRDGAESSLAFAPDMSDRFGHRRADSAHLIQVRGELEGREVLEDADGVHGFEFTTETLSKGWHPAGQLRFLINDGEESPLQWVAWRDRSGDAYSVGLWKPGWSGESEEFTVASLTLKKTAAEFMGYRQPAGHDPVAYRGTLVEPPGIAAVRGGARTGGAGGGSGRHAARLRYRRADDADGLRLLRQWVLPTLRRGRAPL